MRVDRHRSISSCGISHLGAKHLLNPGDVSVSKKKKREAKAKSGGRKLPEALRKNIWPKGVSGNPLGGRLHNPELRAAKVIQQKEYAKIVEILTNSTLLEAEEYLASGKCTINQGAILKAGINAMKYGRWFEYNSALERMIGKVPDRLADENGENVFKGLAELYADAQEKRKLEDK